MHPFGVPPHKNVWSSVELIQDFHPEELWGVVLMPDSCVAADPAALHLGRGNSGVTTTGAGF